MEQFRSQAKAVKYLEDGKQSGQYQDCGNLKLTEVLIMGTGRLFSPYCHKHSLVVDDAPGYRAARPRGLETMSSCPEDCAFFIDTRTHATVEAVTVAAQLGQNWYKRHLELTKSMIRWPFDYFLKLSGIVQALLVILLIVWLFQKFKDTLMEILAAIKNLK
jgi:hypothetical protein